MDRAQERKNLRDGIRGCFAGVAFGDALGMAWETLSAGEIFAATHSKGVTDLQDLPGGADDRHFSSAQGLTLGDTTDDWQLTAACAKSIIRCKGFDLLDQSMVLVEALEQTSAGWGGTTRQSVLQMKTWFNSRGWDGRRPGVAPVHGPNKGAGNGVLMRLSPVGAYYAAHYLRDDWGATSDLCSETACQFSLLTHGVREAVRSAQCLLHIFVDILNCRMNGGHPPMLSRLKTLIAREMTDYRDVEPIRRLLDGPNVSRRILEDPVLLRETTGTSTLASETVAFTLATYLRHQTDFRAAVLEAVNAGGDTDTNASIIGALVGASVGWNLLPQGWLSQVPKVNEAVTLADTFCDALFPA
ncbi:MAG: ADP-ribosylglycohydrolase family protein [bacterium]|nr:ADP-ribosylglycohydrolase family protein [bacterium]